MSGTSKKASLVLTSLVLTSGVSLFLLIYGIQRFDFDGHDAQENATQDINSTGLVMELMFSPLVLFFALHSLVRGSEIENFEERSKVSWRYRLLPAIEAAGLLGVAGYVIKLTVDNYNTDVDFAVSVRAVLTAWSFMFVFLGLLQSYAAYKKDEVILPGRTTDASPTEASPLVVKGEEPTNFNLKGFVTAVSLLVFCIAVTVGGYFAAENAKEHQNGTLGFIGFGALFIGGLGALFAAINTAGFGYQGVTEAWKAPTLGATH